MVPVAALFAVLALALFRSGGQPSGRSINSVFGDVTLEPRVAEQFTLKLLGGQELSLGSLRGKVVMVDFWSSWCPPCRQEAPELAKTYNAYQDRDVVFLGVAIWDDETAVRQFIQRNGIAYPNGMDNRGTVAIAYGVRGIPEKFFIDRKGNLVRKFIGPVTASRLSTLLDQMLAQ
jgi:cytochrome c biogenesis protein CcmG/thiol:disulfide interchange protein DsbE